MTDGAYLCGPRPPTPEDLAIVAEFAAFLAGEAPEKENDMKQVHVFPSDTPGNWVVRADGFPTQEDAALFGRQAAREIGTELNIHGVDGRIREKDSHGNDPKEIKG